MLRVGCRRRGSRWSARHGVVEPAGQLEAEVVVDGGRGRMSRAPPRPARSTVASLRCGTWPGRAPRPRCRRRCRRRRPPGPRPGGPRETGAGRRRRPPATWGSSPSRRRRPRRRRSCASSPRASVTRRGSVPGRAMRPTRSGTPSPPGPAGIGWEPSASSASRSRADAAGTSSGPTRPAYGLLRCVTWAVSASSRGVAAGGKTAASSTSPSKRARSAAVVGVAGMPSRLTRRAVGTQRRVARVRPPLGVGPAHPPGLQWPDAAPTRRPVPVADARAGLPRPHQTTARWTVAHYQAMGSIPPKRHTQHRRPGRGKRAGELYYEELMGEEGFSSDSSLLYHRGIPSAVAEVREWIDRRPLDDVEPPPRGPAPAVARPLRAPGGVEDRRRHRTAPRPRQRRRAHLVCRGRSAEPVVPQRDR